MDDSIFLAGRVIKRSLPVLRSSGDPAAPRLKRLLLPQGELTQFYDSDHGMRYLAVIELRAGGVRGNHYHNIKEELVYVVEGKLQLIVEDISTRDRATFQLEAGELAIIQTGIAHALMTVEPGKAVECSHSRFDAADSFPYRLSVAP